MAVTENIKLSKKRYLKTLKEIRFRVKPSEYEEYQNAAMSMGYPSMRQFYLDAIKEKIAKGCDACVDRNTEEWEAESS